MIAPGPRIVKVERHKLGVINGTLTRNASRNRRGAARHFDIIRRVDIAGSLQRARAASA